MPDDQRTPPPNFGFLVLEIELPPLVSLAVGVAMSTVRALPIGKHIPVATVATFARKVAERVAREAKARGLPLDTEKNVADMLELLGAGPLLEEMRAAGICTTCGSDRVCAHKAKLN